jgi:xanthine dehydrogenase accessory factor
MSVAIAVFILMGGILTPGRGSVHNLAVTFRDVARDVELWRREGEEVALATVVRTWGSGPRGPGAKMALTRDARIAGSVSGGCVEAAVVEEGREVLETGTPKLLRFGVADETAWNVGLSCGGTIEIFVEKLEDSLVQALSHAFEERRAVARATVVRGPNPGKTAVVIDGTTGEGELAAAAGKTLEKGLPEVIQTTDGSEVFIDVELPPPSLVMVGGVHVSIALTSIAKVVGYRTIVIDPRGVFGNEERFPHVDELIQEWPDDALAGIGIDRSTAIATLTHDPKIDDPALLVALRSPAFYVGALGSKKTQEKRKKRLLDRGLTEAELSRLHAPVGLDIGSRSPEEIALSVMGEILAVRNRVM